jgi:hypothetical protein
MKRKRTEITLDQKREICLYKDENYKITNIELIQHFNLRWNVKLGESTVSEILKNRDKFFNADNFMQPQTKRIRLGHYPELEKRLYSWISDKLSIQMPLSEEIIRAKAIQLGEELSISTSIFKYSAGWLDKFKRRYNIHLLNMSNNKASTNKDNSLSLMSDLHNEKNEVKQEDSDKLAENKILSDQIVTKADAKHAHEILKNYFLQADELNAEVFEVLDKLKDAIDPQS